MSDVRYIYRWTGTGAAAAAPYAWPAPAPYERPSRVARSCSALARERAINFRRRVQQADRCRLVICTHVLSSMYTHRARRTADLDRGRVRERSTSPSRSARGALRHSPIVESKPSWRSGGRQSPVLSPKLRYSALFCSAVELQPGALCLQSALGRQHGARRHTAKLTQGSNWRA